MKHPERPHWPDFEQLQTLIGYAFKEPDLLVQALCHSSYTKHPSGAHINNERLEFLGDRVVNLCIAEMIYHRLKDQSEGRLSKKVATLVRKETLAAVARRIGLGDYLLLGKGERTTGGAEKDNILADAVEALLAAIFLDCEGSVQEARAFIERFWTEDIMAVTYIDAKSRLQEWLQKQGEPLPEYRVIAMEGEAHDAVFHVCVLTRNYGEAKGEGKSKQQAQQEAARALYENIRESEKV